MPILVYLASLSLSVPLSHVLGSIPISVGLSARWNMALSMTKGRAVLVEASCLNVAGANRRPKADLLGVWGR